MSTRNNNGKSKSPRAIVSTVLPVGLFKELHAMGDDHAAMGEEKHALFSDMLAHYIEVWEANRLPRMHIGIHKHDSKQTSFYVSTDTKRCLTLIGKADGVSMATVIRTGFCWYLYHKQAGSRRDVWGSKVLLGEIPDLGLD